MASTHAWDNLTHDMCEEMHDLTHFATVDAAHQSRVALWATFVALPVLWGLDMMTNAVTDSTTWEGSISTWADNFRAHPEIDVQDGPEAKPYRARELSGEERQEWWDHAVATWDTYASYQQKTDRQIPVFLLEPVS